LSGGAELLAGVVQDPLFGPLVAFGPGGTLAELIGSARFALAPLTDVDVDVALSTGKAARLVAGWRGAPPRGPRCTRRPAAPPVAPRDRAAGGGGARPEPRARAGGRVCRGGRTGTRPSTRAERQREDVVTETVTGTPLRTEELRLLDAWWRAANYLSVGQI